MMFVVGILASLAQLAATSLVYAQEAAEVVSDAEVVQPPAKRKLDGATRTKAMAALASLVILGVGLIAFIWLGARMTRRYMKSGAKPPKPPLDPIFTDDWANKPLTPEERERLASDEW
jgi:hypothetical protein